MPDSIPTEHIFDDNVLNAVGLLFLTAAQVETVLSFQLGRLIAHPETRDSATVIAIQGAGITVLLQQIKTLAKFRAPQQYDEIKKCCGRIRKAFEPRNHIAHYMSIEPRQKDSIQLIPLKMKENGDFIDEKPYTAQQIKGFAHRLYNLMRELDSLLTNAGITPLPK